LIQNWVNSLPSQSEIDHPLLWSEEAQEVLQASSTNKIYRVLDDIEEDATWMVENVFGKDRSRFPASATWNGETIECFTASGFKWAMALAQSRSFFLDDKLRLIPVLDFCNHDDSAEEVRTSGMGVFGSVKGVQLVASSTYKPGDEVFCSYGPKSAADYLLEFGFIPDRCWKTSISELTFEIDPIDRFYDDKLDILEFETYNQAPMNPVQSFDVVSAPGREGEPDPAMMQFLRLATLGSTDAFLLESTFRKDVWGLMLLPVSEKNELEVVNKVVSSCQLALDEMGECPDAGPEVCKRLRQSESRALTRTIEYLLREREALDLKEYYQERRLKDLGLDSQWSPEDDIGSELNYGQTRLPGGADFDW
jgi:[ribulose-bisphosphate carboxylase]-lysine N-methyltransferase